MTASRQEARDTLAPPKNGKFYQVLVLGGTEHNARNARSLLAKQLGIVLYEHRGETKKAASKTIPLCVDFVILLVDAMGHSGESTIIKQCKQQGVPFLRAGRKAAFLIQALHDFGVTVTAARIQAAVEEINSNDPRWEEEEEAPAAPAPEPEKPKLDLSGWLSAAEAATRAQHPLAWLEVRAKRGELRVVRHEGATLFSESDVQALAEKLAQEKDELSLAERVTELQDELQVTNELWEEDRKAWQVKQAEIEHQLNEALADSQRGRDLARTVEDLLEAQKALDLKAREKAEEYRRLEEKRQLKIDDLSVRLDETEKALARALQEAKQSPVAKTWEVEVSKLQREILEAKDLSNGLKLKLADEQLRVKDLERSLELANKRVTASNEVTTKLKGQIVKMQQDMEKSEKTAPATPNVTLPSLVTVYQAGLLTKDEFIDCIIKLSLKK